MAWSDQGFLIQPSSGYPLIFRVACLIITKGLPAATATTCFTAREREAGILKAFKHGYQTDCLDPGLFRLSLHWFQWVRA